MKNLVIPCCDRNFINGKPKYLNIYPDGTILARKSLGKIDCKLYDAIYYILLKEDVEKYNADKLILEATSDIPTPKHVVLLDKMTSGPAETVYEAINKIDLSGSLVIKDIDNKLHIGNEEGNFVAGLNIVDYSRNIFEISKKSFLIVNEQNVILDIAEKRVCSDIISAGVYGFENVEDFVWAYKSLQDEYYPIKHLYVSHLISYLIGMKKKTFRVIDVHDYESWGTEREWNEAISYYYKQNPKEKLIMIDLDGTLVDTSLINFHAYRQALEEEGFSLPQSYFDEKCNGTNYKEFLPPILGEQTDVLIKKIHDRKLELYQSYIKEGKLNNFLVELIKKMKDTYYVVLATTASKKNVIDVVDYFGIESLFDRIFTAEDVSKLKPSPEVFEKALEYFGIERENAVIFEDSSVGVQAAKNAGIKCYKFME